MASGTAAQIRALRIRTGQSQDEMALRLGLNPAWYGDLERDDGELAATLTLFQALELASLLRVQLHELFPGTRASVTPLALVELPALIEAHIAREGLSLAQLEERTDWALQDFIAAPVQTAAELPLAFFQSLASTLGVDWLSLVPEVKD